MKRFRRLRNSKSLRELVAETELDIKDFIYPIFVIEGIDIKEPVDSMPGVYRYSIDRLSEILNEIRDKGISGILLFGIPLHKDPSGTEAYNSEGVIAKAVRYIKKEYPELICIVDVCLCEYTDHGHCGLIHYPTGKILNDETLPLLTNMAVTAVKAGADMVAPSDMMDGDVSAIREGLDAAGFYDVPIMGYSAKFASGYYGPFRDAADSAPKKGNRCSYQMDIRNGREAIRELENDIEMGADIIMVKPALAYLDIVKEASLSYNMPLAVYNVSGEYSMVKAAAANGWIDEKRIVMENMYAFKRAGANIIISYHALEVADWIGDGYEY
ncbi:MAG: porphobilinogen synthase [Eubacterium sp.]|nr:porphobilinogen synthase [Eubacterium sp.]